MTEYFYILTITWTEASGVQIYTHTGVTDVHDGQDQQSVYWALHAEACKDAGAPLRAGVSYYYLARNEL